MIQAETPSLLQVISNKYRKFDNKRFLFQEQNSQKESLLKLETDDSKKAFTLKSHMSTSAL